MRLIPFCPGDGIRICPVDERARRNLIRALRFMKKHPYERGYEIGIAVCLP